MYNVKAHSTFGNNGGSTLSKKPWETNNDQIMP